MTHIGRAFQASSPKDFHGPVGNDRAFFLASHRTEPVSPSSIAMQPCGAMG
jgi:hypothetical protein